jgi:hypothetical protein
VPRKASVANESIGSIVSGSKSDQDEGWRGHKSRARKPAKNRQNPGTVLCGLKAHRSTFLLSLPGEHPLNMADGFVVAAAM